VYNSNGNNSYLACRNFNECVAVLLAANRPTFFHKLTSFQCRCAEFSSDQLRLNISKNFCCSEDFSLRSVFDHRYRLNRGEPAV